MRNKCRTVFFGLGRSKHPIPAPMAVCKPKEEKENKQIKNKASEIIKAQESTKP